MFNNIEKNIYRNEGRDGSTILTPTEEVQRVGRYVTFNFMQRFLVKFVLLDLWMYVILDRCLSFCDFSFGHCVACPFSIYDFWVTLWYLQILLHNLVYQHCVLSPLCDLFQSKEKNTFISIIFPMPLSAILSMSEKSYTGQWHSHEVTIFY